MTSKYQVKVSTDLPNTQFKHLYQLAEKHGTTVGALVAQMVDQVMTAPVKQKRGAQSRYTAETGVRMLVLRELHRSQEEIAVAIGVSRPTVGQWMRLAEHDERMEQMNKQEEAK